MIICITGMPGAGKTEAGNMLRQHGFKEVEMSATIKERMKREGIELDNKNIREFSLKQRALHGNDVVARWTMEMIKDIPEKDLLIVGLRSEDEAKYFKKFEEVKIICITAPKETRFERLKARHREDDPDTYADFEYREDKEKQFGIESAIKHADYIIHNNGTIADLEGKVSEVLEELREYERRMKQDKQKRNAA